MSSRIILLSALFCSGVWAAAPDLPELPDSVQRMYIYGASAAAPQEKGWYVASHTPYQVGITKLGKTKDATIVIQMQDFKLSPPEANEDFAALVKQGESKSSDPQRFTEKVHDVTSAKLGDAVCAHSHMLSEDKAAKTPTGEITDMFIEAYALNCRHPEQPLMGVNVTYSVRYHAGDRDPQLEQQAGALLDSVQFMPLKK